MDNQIDKLRSGRHLKVLLLSWLMQALEKHPQLQRVESRRTSLKCRWGYIQDIHFLHFEIGYLPIVSCIIAHEIDVD